MSFRAEFSLLAEMRHQRRDAPAEQAVEQAAALAVHPVLALEHGRVQVASAVLAARIAPFFSRRLSRVLMVAPASRAVARQLSATTSSARSGLRVHSTSMTALSASLICMAIVYVCNWT
jgi:hypothetical protein